MSTMTKEVILYLNKKQTKKTTTTQQAVTVMSYGTINHLYNHLPITNYGFHKSVTTIMLT